MACLSTSVELKEAKNMLEIHTVRAPLYTAGGFVWCDRLFYLPSKNASGKVGV